MSQGKRPAARTLWRLAILLTLGGFGVTVLAGTWILGGLVFGPGTMMLGVYRVLVSGGRLGRAVGWMIVAGGASFLFSSLLWMVPHE